MKAGDRVNIDLKKYRGIGRVISISEFMVHVLDEADGVDYHIPKCDAKELDGQTESTGRADSKRRS